MSSESAQTLLCIRLAILRWDTSNFPCCALVSVDHQDPSDTWLLVWWSACVLSSLGCRGRKRWAKWSCC
jgi:hypothetical protein